MRINSIKKGKDYWILIVIASLFTIGQIFPLVWLIDFSLLKSSEFFAGDILKWPNPPQFQNYVTAWIDGNFVRFFFNSVLVATITIIVTVFLSLTLGYAFTRMKWRFRRLFLNIILLGMMIPIHATLIPNFFIFQKLGLLNTYQGLILPYVAFSMPLGVFIMTGFLETIPRALEEAALIDGCSIYGIIFRIVLPLCKPAIVTVVILTFFNSWNEFIMAATYLSSDKFRTLPFAVMNFAGEYSSNYAAQFAVMALNAIPAIIIYILFNEQVTKGFLAGAIKE